MNAENFVFLEIRHIGAKKIKNWRENKNVSMLGKLTALYFGAISRRSEITETPCKVNNNQIHFLRPFFLTSLLYVLFALQHDGEFFLDIFTIPLHWPSIDKKRCLFLWFGLKMHTIISSLLNSQIIWTWTFENKKILTFFYRICKLTKVAEI